MRGLKLSDAGIAVRCEIRVEIKNFSRAIGQRRELNEEEITGRLAGDYWLGVFGRRKFAVLSSPRTSESDLHETDMTIGYESPSKNISKAGHDQRPRALLLFRPFFSRGTSATRLRGRFISRGNASSSRGNEDIQARPGETERLTCHGRVIFGN